MVIHGTPIRPKPDLQPITDPEILKLMSGWRLSEEAQRDIAAIEANVAAALAAAPFMRVD